MIQGEKGLIQHDRLAGEVARSRIILELSLKDNRENLIVLREGVAERFRVLRVVVTTAILFDDRDDLASVQAAVGIDCINGGLNLLDHSVGATVVGGLEAQGFLELAQVRDDVADFDRVRSHTR